MGEMQSSGATADLPEPDEQELAVRPLSVTGAEGPLAARLYTPAGSRGDGLIVFFPGGGFVADELEQANFILRLLALRTGWLVLGSSYTPASVCPFPAAAEDAHAVLCWVGRNRRKLGWSGRKLVSAGIESGGNLAAVSALMAR
ncbi:MAG TPA: alpha/beta hydrolase fold domain-containing protein, partial [Noviherbaspirillum sp.]